MTVHAFRTPTGLLVPAITTEQMREVDRVAVEEVGPNLYQMMENAGRNLASLCAQTLGTGWGAAPIMVLAGTGGNGGGGLCAARHLVNHGGQVTVVVSEPSRLTGVPAEQLALYRAAGGRIASVAEVDTIDAVLVVDAVLGYSLGGAPRGPAGELVAWLSSRTNPVISLDVPSGLDSTTGEAAGAFVRASATLTLALPKTGLDVEAVGRLWLADLGIPREVYRRVGVQPPPNLFTSGYRVELTADVDRSDGVN
ncbi:MAG TPA: NAD(P)H-hydrate epimerase [Cellulomonadaceae bacterium]|nr:NAD(P)H-hydrate epimerase [Cellulomonadaceae bacterium]